MGFKEILSGLKGYLKDNLKDDNVEMITRIDKELDSLSDEHSKTEKDLSSTKDKLIDVVKNTSFKDDNAKDTPEDDTDAPMDIDTALSESIKEIEDNRK